MKVERMVRSGQIARQRAMRSRVFSCAAGRVFLTLEMVEEQLPQRVDRRGNFGQFLERAEGRQLLEELAVFLRLDGHFLLAFLGLALDALHR